MAHTVSDELSDVTLNRIMAIESAGKPRAKAKTSSALGLFQFLNKTWDGIVKKYRPDLKEGRSTEQVRALRLDPSISIELGARFTEDNAKGLGRGYTDGDLYLAHFLGLNTARKVLRAAPDTPASQVCTPDQIKANKSILSGKTCRQVRAWAEKSMETRWAGLGEVDWVKKFYHADPHHTPVKHEENFDHLDDDEDTPKKVDEDTTTDEPAEPSVVDDTISDLKDQAREGLVSKIKTLFKSKIAWLGGILGCTGTGSTVTSDPEVQGLLWRLLQKPAFWIMVASIVLTVAIVYFRWRDHGRGKP